MRIHVRFFAAYRDRTGHSDLSQELPEGSTVQDLREALCRKFPGLPVPEQLVVAVNAEYVGADHPLADGDEAALIPPVSGGAA